MADTESSSFHISNGVQGGPCVVAAIGFLFGYLFGAGWAADPSAGHAGAQAA